MVFVHGDEDNLIIKFDDVHLLLCDCNFVRFLFFFFICCYCLLAAVWFGQAEPCVRCLLHAPFSRVITGSSIEQTKWCPLERMIVSSGGGFSLSHISCEMGILFHVIGRQSNFYIVRKNAHFIGTTQVFYSCCCW